MNWKLKLVLFGVSGWALGTSNESITGLVDSGPPGKLQLAKMCMIQTLLRELIRLSS